MSKLSDIQKLVAKALTEEAVLDAIGKSAVRAIKRRTRAGSGVEENLKSAKKLPKLKDQTKARRRRLKRAGGLTAKGATPAKSNLSRSGKLIDSVTYEVGDGNVEIKLKTSAQQEKAKELINIDSGYKFMKLSKAEFRRAIKAATGAITPILKRININNL